MPCEDEDVVYTSCVYLLIHLVFEYTLYLCDIGHQT